MVDDQASLKIQNINRQFTAMGNQVGTTQGRINSFNSAINTNSRTFTASANAIKTQGNALANNTKNIAANSTQFTTLGSKVKATASQFAGMATGLAVTASGALQLAAGFRDYNDAQIAVDRVTRKLSLATEAQHKAQDKLNALTAKGVKSGKAYQQAQLDVSQANAAVSIQTDLLGEAQERMFDSQTQFVASIIPTTLGALGTLGSAFKDLGGTKGLGGLVDKFKGLGGILTGAGGGFKSLGLAASGIVPSITSIGSKSGDAIKGIVGVGGASSTAAIGVGGLKAALSGMALSLGALIGIPLGGIFAANALGNTFHEFHDIGDKVRKQQLEMAKAFGLTDVQVKQLNDAMNTINRIFGIYEPDIKKATTATQGLDKTFKTMTPSINSAATSSSALVNRIIVLRTQAEKGQITWNQYFDALAALKIPGDKFTAVMDEVNIRMKNNVPLTDAAAKSAHGFAQSGGEVDDALKKLGPTIIAVDKNTKDLNNALVAGFQTMQNAAPKDLFEALAKGGPIIQTLRDETKAADPPMKALIGTLNKGGPVMDDFLGSAKALGPGLGEWNTAIDQVAIHNQEAEASFKSLAKTMKDDLEKAAADAQSAIDKMRGGVQSGLDKIIEAFHKVHKKGKLDFEVNFDKAKKGFDKFLAEVGDKLDHGGSANAQKYILAFEKKGTTGMSKSSARMFQPLFDWIEKHKDEPADVFMSGFLQMLATFDPKVSQQFKKLIDPSIGLAGEIGKKAGKEFSEELMAAINSTLKIADRFANIGGHPGRGSLKDTTPVKIQTEFIPPKTPVPTPKTPVKVPSTFIPPPPPPAPKEQVKVPSVFIPPPPIPSPKTPVKVPAVLELATNFNLAGLWESAGIKKPVTVPARLGFGPSQGGNLKPGVNEFTTGTSHGFNSPSDIQARMRVGKNPKPGGVEGAQQGTQPGDDLAEFWTGQMTRHGNRPVPIIPNKPPTSNFFPASSGGAQVMSNAKPQINIEMALKQIDVIAKRIMGLSTIMPVLTLNNAAAIKAIDVIATRLVSLTKVAPTITLINAKAIKAIDVIATRIMSLTGIAPAISLTNTLAFKIVDAVAKRIISLEKIKPNISISNTQALKIVDTVGKRIDSLEKIKPSISLSNTQAIKVVDAVAKRINGLSNINPTVHVGLSGPGASLASKGDTSSKFDLAGSKADSGGGDTIVNLNISGNEIVNEQRITRRVKRSMGSDRFVYGV